jgi:predicted metalloprotease with PDZ domain
VISDAENHPGRRLVSPIDASLAAPFIDSTLHRQRTNIDNTYLTYYYSGELVALVLDLMIRGRSNGTRSLDDVLKRMYDEFYVKSPNATYYLKGRGYTVEDFVRVLSEVAGTDMSGFYERHIRGAEPLPYAEAFAAVGLNLVKTPYRQEYTAGIVLDPADRQNLRLGVSVNGSPAERAGLQQGDILLTIGGVPVDRGNWRSVLYRYPAGERVTVQVQRFRQTVARVLEIGQIDVFSYRFEEIPNASSDARARRAAWLAGPTN